jgi:hypothetical protein
MSSEYMSFVFIAVGFLVSVILGAEILTSYFKRRKIRREAVYS